MSERKERARSKEKDSCWGWPAMKNKRKKNPVDEPALILPYIVRSSLLFRFTMYQTESERGSSSAFCMTNVNLSASLLLKSLLVVDMIQLRAGIDCSRRSLVISARGTRGRCTSCQKRTKGCM